jgi:hypothetical protein
MKTFVLILSFVSFSAVADVPDFWPKQATCEEIQTAMTQYGSVKINVKYLFGSETFLVTPERQNCRGFYRNSRMRVRTMDGYNCNVGYYCERREIDRD